MKSGKDFFSDLLQKKKGLPPAGQQPAMDSSKGPGGQQGPQAGQPGIEVKPDRDQMATRIKRTPLYIAAAVVGLGAYGGYEYLQSHSMFGNARPQAQAKTIRPANGTGAPAAPKHRKQVHKPTAPGDTSGAPATSPTNSAGGPSHLTPAPVSTGPKKNPYAAQDAAFASALGTGNAGSGSGDGLAWKTQVSTPSAQAPTDLPTALPGAALPGAEQSAAKKTKKKTPPPLVTRETSPYEILSGSVIPAVLQAGIKSYLPGEITAVVSQNVYSSVNGATLLIPAGAKLVGTYDTQTALGINRLAVAWTRIQFPNGTTMNLPGYEGAGGAGYAGFAGEVNDHTWLIFKNALLMSIVDAGMAIASPSTSTSVTGQMSGNVALQDSEQSLAQTFGEAESQLLEKYIDIAPTIIIHPGYLFSVVVAHDMVFPGPYNPAMQTGSAMVDPALGPNLNPYGLHPAKGLHPANG
ncbi:TrbI/VirB10 family protein [Acidithiobacillus ferrooxidans]|jgi:type IV secretion system protein VirB10|uniref:Conjugal transfer protein TrbI n=1 Tax=Acidithiobacillus ferrooxidans TaxID=920 RepID=A0A2W1KLK3_ACIFR|nr:TrbI/VirB10 family protein [Acidithiobacillus ferrooxidans]MBU2774748.1 TrbI/VirB10 family protein [Acidithiobacillus ferrooxidans]MCR0969980.1 TrbI/VirB10 family protein [Acidithiobacillus ferrooxidans]MCR1343842.1 TrbI/VirB10 family protein [Acidithiobacillus ferrooxidans]MCR1350272.1 TrbI/VirB10 family protein [Acidithiobacillus ferrooxidans]MCR1351429.1 TrbI/VirB10 family protein [Acidithiobacillus ferrooxidans]